MDKNPEIESISQYLRRAYVRDYMTVEKRAKQLEQELKKINHIKKEIKRLKKDNETFFSKLPPEAVKWLKAEGKRRARKYTEEGVFNYFINKYALHNKLNRRQFRILLNQ